jgi:hypothetical protein
MSGTDEEPATEPRTGVEGIGNHAPVEVAEEGTAPRGVSGMSLALAASCSLESRREMLSSSNG